eukprot:2866432-Pleurochrysis_carterae.AAC.1
MAKDRASSRDKGEGRWLTAGKAVGTRALSDGERQGKQWGQGRGAVANGRESSRVKGAGRWRKTGQAVGTRARGDG